VSGPIIVDGVSKKYRWHRDKRTSVKERMARGRPEMLDEFWALREVSFEVPAGSTFGLVGHNGSGKSTLLKLMAGIIRPTTGSVATVGRMSALLEVGAGFHPELTGRENVYLNGSILGLSRKQIDASIDGIIDFAGIGEFIDVPVKVYSSGMYVRLGFSIAVTVDPEVLLVDEIVAVGDEEFQRKCFDHLHELHRKGTTIVIVSHSLGIIESLCDRAIWLDHGVLQKEGTARDIVHGYLESVNDNEAAAEAAKATLIAASAPEEPEVVEPEPDPERHRRRGSGEVQVTRVELLNANGNPVKMLKVREAATIRMHYEVHQPVPLAVFGLGFYTESGILVAGPNTGPTMPLHDLTPGTGYVDFTIPDLLLAPDTYSCSTGVIDKGHVYDHVMDAFELKVRGAGGQEPGLTRLPGTWSAPDRDG
jgi:ABC-2 type transport system ATP-binding protein/lipopolysaccharide transport system ATP-binding protein